MSTVKWTDPNNPENEYDIGVEGLEHAISKKDNPILYFIANRVHELYPLRPITSALATMVLDWDGNAVVPTYGKWAGPGWGGGKRASTVDWTEPPC